MAETCRIAWPSAAARAVWEPRIRAVSNAWLDVELVSVAKGLRPVALVFQRPNLDTRCEELRLVKVEVAHERYAVSRPHDDVPGNAVGTVCAWDLYNAYRNHDDAHVGELLGFPRCCRGFFDRVWNVDQKRDTTLSMGGATLGTGDWQDRPVARVTAPASEANILGRWLGVRMVPHLPCAFDCPETIAFARRLAPLWPRQELAWAEEILSWPVSYSALHSVAVITFPIVRVVTATDYTARAHRLEVDGTRYPAEAPRGLAHPFRPPAAAVSRLALHREAPVCI